MEEFIFVTRANFPLGFVYILDDNAPFKWHCTFNILN
jgi:hypothetical protein